MKKKIDWTTYDQELVNRGSLTFWMSEEAMEEWVKPNGQTRGAQIFYAEIGLELLMVLRFRYSLTLRGVQGFARSIFEMMDLFLPVPHYSTMSRRLKDLPAALKVKLSGSEPLHVVMDSTGLKVYGEGEWKVRQHGYSKRRTWRKLHLAVDAGSNQILSAAVTTNDFKDNQLFGDLLDEVEGDIANVSGDGAYDSNDCYAKAGERNFFPSIPPMKGAKIKTHGNSTCAKGDRDENIRAIRQQGRKGWKVNVNYHQRSLSETAMYRFKSQFGGSLRSREFDRQCNEAFIKCQMLNRMTTPKAM